MADTAHLSDLEIQGLLDDALPAADARRVRAHLAVCRACARRREAQVRLFAAIESWEETPPARDLAPGIVRRLSQRKVPFGLSVATAVQALLALVIVGLAWPLVADLFSSLPRPAISGFDVGTAALLATRAGQWVSTVQSGLRPLLDSADVLIRLAPQWVTLSPVIAAAALLGAVLGNSILLAGDSGRGSPRPRRL